VLFLSAEEPEVEIRRRAYRIARKDEGLQALTELRFWFPDDVGDCLMSVTTAGMQIQATPLYHALRKLITDMRPTLVIVDNVAAIYGGDQNHRGQVRAFMNLWRGLARASGAAILLLNHPSLNGLTAGTGRGGSMDWRNAVRSALHLKPAADKADADRGVRVLECVKSNYAPLGEPVRLIWTDGILAPEGTEPAHVRAAQDQAAEAKFLELLDHFTKLGIDSSPNAGRNYAPTLFEKSEQSGGFRRRALAAAMERLLAGGRIKVETTGPASRQKKILVRVTQ
jgi:RecA-family ATPase